MTDPNPSGATDTAEFIPFEEFRNGLPFGRFHVIVNPVLARRFVAQRTHASPLAIAIIGIGIATALAGHVITGAVLVGIGVLFRRAVRWQADKILLHLTTRHETTYLAATTQGVMEVQRR